ncbi:MAG: GNAT family N-acetyltransferase [Thermonemataceae bacterium]
MFASQDIVQIFFPHRLQSYELDAFLAEGWFRSCTSMYRSQIICMDEDVFSVVNIRLPLDNYQIKKSLRKNYRKIQDHFRTVVRPAAVDAEKEALYQTHKNRFKGFIFNDLQTYLYANNNTQNIFETYEVAVYDEQEKLVAVSFFDIGKNSVASIIGLYDQSYSNYSLGLYTMLYEIQHAKELAITYYYPGYVFHTPSVFDYKLRLGNYEYYDWQGNWLPYEHAKQASWTADVIKEKIQLLTSTLQREGIRFHQYLYPLFSFGYLEAFQEFEFVKEVLLLQVFPTISTRSTKYFIAYLPEKKTYRYFSTEVFVLADLLGIPQSDYQFNEALYFADPLCYTDLVLESQQLSLFVEEMKRVLC